MICKIRDLKLRAKVFLDDVWARQPIKNLFTSLA